MSFLRQASFVGAKHKLWIQPHHTIIHLPTCFLDRTAIFRSPRQQGPNCNADEEGTRARGGHSGTDSDASDCEGASPHSPDRLKSSKARLAALTCLQLLAKWDPKPLHQLWLSLLPQHSTVAAPARRGHTSLIDVISGDPSSKVSAS